ncbi:hypothetical protein PMI22_00717 [Pseudomonas sp. GM21]|nr:hypothetical protein PMI22_00717 [Pseudomonas sp. GM21]
MPLKFSTDLSGGLEKTSCPHKLRALEGFCPFSTRYHEVKPWRLLGTFLGETVLNSLSHRRRSEPDRRLSVDSPLQCTDNRLAILFSLESKSNDSIPVITRRDPLQELVKKRNSERHTGVGGGLYAGVGGGMYQRVGGGRYAGLGGGLHLSQERPHQRRQAVIATTNIRG